MVFYLSRLSRNNFHPISEHTNTRIHILYYYYYLHVKKRIYIYLHCRVVVAVVCSNLPMYVLIFHIRHIPHCTERQPTKKVCTQFLPVGHVSGLKFYHLCGPKIKPYQPEIRSCDNRLTVSVRFGQTHNPVTSPNSVDLPLGDSKKARKDSKTTRKIVYNCLYEPPIYVFVCLFDLFCAWHFVGAASPFLNQLCVCHCWVCGCPFFNRVPQINGNVPPSFPSTSKYLQYTGNNRTKTILFV
jgi:hypothetical protein